jgi:murein DD-endopeptidase MepM/ murein hydrolase activator NlpD
MKLQKPYKGTAPVTQKFGPAQSGLRYSYHYGIDYGTPNLTPLLSAFSGIVEKVVNSFVAMQGYGRYVVIRSAENARYSILYGHMDSIAVEVGQVVDEGTMIGLSGRSGYVVSLGGGGYHLHFGLKDGEKWIDPFPFFYVPVPVVDSPKTLEATETPKTPLPGVLTGDVKEYVVKKGDNLWNISLRFYGSGVHWQLIYAQNKNIIGSNPDRLAVGLIIGLPKIKK